MDKKGANEFSQIAKTIFAPIYPVIAEQILHRTGIKEGICVDLGSGPADLSIALAKISCLVIYALDCSRPMSQIAQKKIISNGFSDRIKPVVSDVLDLPFENNTVHLMVSRGSLFFWPDRQTVYREVYRVLAPGGMTFIGGGFGNIKLKKEIFDKMRQKFKDWDATVKERLENTSPEVLHAELVDAGLMDFDIINDDSGFWINIKK